jgi:hypothetical protein
MSDIKFLIVGTIITLYSVWLYRGVFVAYVASLKNRDYGKRCSAIVSVWKTFFECSFVILTIPVLLYSIVKGLTFNYDSLVDAAISMAYSLFWLWYLFASGITQHNRDYLLRKKLVSKEQYEDSQYSSYISLLTYDTSEMWRIITASISVIAIAITVAVKAIS